MKSRKIGSRILWGCFLVSIYNWVLQSLPLEDSLSLFWFWMFLGALLIALSLMFPEAQ